MSIKRKKGKITEESLLEAGFKVMTIEDRSLPPNAEQIYWYELELGNNGDLLLITNAVNVTSTDPKFYIEIFESCGLGRCFTEKEMWELLKILTRNKDILVKYN
jgi:hypothetical protein